MTPSTDSGAALQLCAKDFLQLREAVLRLRSTPGQPMEMYVALGRLAGAVDQVRAMLEHPGSVAVSIPAPEAVKANRVLVGENDNVIDAIHAAMKARARRE